ncbi:MAG TPA: class I SAM-dependent methyltransferase [Rhodopila sp.]
MDRVATIRSMFATSGHGLEIGPSFDPLFPKNEGFEVDIVDHASAEDLRRKYRDERGIDCSRIEEVDHVWDGRPLTEVIGRTACYDYIVASHVIEHTPDLLGFLKECDGLLKPGGVLFLAVPDKRRCFDILRPLSTTGGVLQAHLERRTRHIPAVAFDHVAYFATLDGVGAWPARSSGDLNLANELSFARAIYERSLASSDYYDFHAWTFCPSSFRMILKDLNDLGALSLREDKFLLTAGIEFLVTISRSGAGCNWTRRDLLAGAQEELSEFPVAATEPVSVSTPEPAPASAPAPSAAIPVRRGFAGGRAMAPLRGAIRALRGH